MESEITWNIIYGEIGCLAYRSENFCEFEFTRGSALRFELRFKLNYSVLFHRARRFKTVEMIHMYKNDLTCSILTYLCLLRQLEALLIQNGQVTGVQR